MKSGSCCHCYFREKCKNDQILGLLIDEAVTIHTKILQSVNVVYATQRETKFDRKILQRDSRFFSFSFIISSWISMSLNTKSYMVEGQRSLFSTCVRPLTEARDYSL